MQAARVRAVDLLSRYRSKSTRSSMTDEEIQELRTMKAALASDWGQIREEARERARLGMQSSKPPTAGSFDALAPSLDALAYQEHVTKSIMSQCIREFNLGENTFPQNQLESSGRVTKKKLTTLPSPIDTSSESLVKEDASSLDRRLR